MASRRDVRPYIYYALDQLFAIAYVVAIVALIPNRHASVAIHLWLIPIAMQVMAIGTLLVVVPAARPAARLVALAGGTLVLALTVLLLVRVLVSAAFLASVYGAFGQAAASFAFVFVALLVELVALLPIVQVKYLMSRAGRAAYA